MNNSMHEYVSGYVTLRLLDKFHIHSLDRLSCDFRKSLVDEIMFRFQNKNHDNINVEEIAKEVLVDFLVIM